MSGTLKQIVFDWGKLRQVVTTRELYQAFPMLPRKSLRETLYELAREGWVDVKRQCNTYSFRQDVPRPADRRGRPKG